MSLLAAVDTRHMTEQAWLEARRRFIGGSDIAKILGISKWGTAFTVFLDKRGELPQEEAGEAAYWGTTLEEIVAQEFTIRTGLKVRKRNAILMHPQHTWMGANVDRLIVGAEEGLECKTASAYLSKLWESDELPDEYYAQCQWYMAVTGYQAWWIAVLIGGQRFLHKRVERDEAFIEAAIQVASEFWHKHVLTGEPPIVDGTNMASEYLTKLHPEANGEVIDLPPDAQALVERYLEAKQDEKEAKERADLYSNQLKAVLGDSERAFAGEHKVVWANRNRESVDTKRLKEELPDIASRYMKVTAYRQFDVK